jgi:hypothetical protein
MNHCGCKRGNAPPQPSEVSREDLWQSDRERPDALVGAEASVVPHRDLQAVGRCDLNRGRDVHDKRLVKLELLATARLVALHTTLCLCSLDVLVVDAEVHLNVRLARSDAGCRQVHDSRPSGLASTCRGLEDNPETNAPRHCVSGADVVLPARANRHEA